MAINWLKLLGIIVLVAMFITGIVLAGVGTGGTYTAGVVLVGVSLGLGLIWLIWWLITYKPLMTDVDVTTPVIVENVGYSGRDVDRAYSSGLREGNREEREMESPSEFRHRHM